MIERKGFFFISQYPPDRNFITISPISFIFGPGSMNDETNEMADLIQHPYAQLGRA